jgi:hypothetical protein
MTIQIIAYTDSICNAKPKKHLFALKSQITSVPSTSANQRKRDRVVVGEQILGDKLTLDEAIKMAQGGGR